MPSDALVQAGIGLTETINIGSKIKPATANPLDVNQDGVVSPLAALMIINELDLQSSAQSFPPRLWPTATSTATAS